MTWLQVVAVLLGALVLSPLVLLAVLVAVQSVFGMVVLVVIAGAGGAAAYGWWLARR